MELPKSSKPQHRIALPSLNPPHLIQLIRLRAVSPLLAIAICCHSALSCLVLDSASSNQHSSVNLPSLF